MNVTNFIEAADQQKLDAAVRAILKTAENSFGDADDDMISTKEIMLAGFALHVANETMQDYIASVVIPAALEGEGDDEEETAPTEGQTELADEPA